MNTLAIIRLHTFDACPELVWDAVAAHADGLLFVTHRLLALDLARRAAQHPKCLKVHASTDSTWNNHRSLQACAKLSDEYAPQRVMIFDEDEIPPARLGGELDAWDMTAHPVMTFRFFHSFGEPDQVTAERLDGYGPHCKVYAWSPEVSRFGFQAFCTPVVYAQRASHFCPYPLRHLAYMTPAQRAARSAREKRPERSWWEGEIRTIPYDPGLTWSEWNRRSKGEPR